MPDCSAVEQLQERYQDRMAGALASPLPVAAVTSNTVPWELLDAAGYFPVLLSPPAGPTPHADAYMEDVFDARSRGIFERFLSGEWAFIDTLVIPRTSEQEHKLFLYLREVARQEPERKLPRVLLYNLPHARSAEARIYGLERTRELMKALPPTLSGGLEAAIAEGNAARQAARSILELRRSRLSGARALPLIGAFYFMDRARYAGLAAGAARELAGLRELQGPRLLVKGAALPHPHLHTAIESHGAIVACEDDWWGSRAAGKDIRDDIDPVDAIFEKYYLDAPSPRVFPPSQAEAWFLHELSAVDGVVFYIPPEDYVFGWDYPRLRDLLDCRNIPHLLVSADASSGTLSAEWHSRIEEFVARVKR